MTLATVVVCLNPSRYSAQSWCQDLLLATDWSGDDVKLLGQLPGILHCQAGRPGEITVLLALKPYLLQGQSSSRRGLSRMPNVDIARVPLLGGDGGRRDFDHDERDGGLSCGRPANFSWCTAKFVMVHGRRRSDGQVSPLMLDRTDVIAPTLKWRLSGVTATMARLLPVQAQTIKILATGPGLPTHVPQVPLRSVLVMSRRRCRVWHARRNTEMLLGILLRHVLRKRLKLVFTSASQRHHTRYTRWLIAQMDAVVSTSHRTASYLHHPSQVIQHGIDGSAFHPLADRRALRQELGLAEGFTIGCFGRIRRQKGTDDFVAAMLRVMQQCPGVQALVMGRARARHQQFLQTLRDKVADAGLAGSTTLPRWTSQLRVNDGTILPPISDIMIIAAASPVRRP